MGVIISLRMSKLMGRWQLQAGTWEAGVVPNMKLILYALTSGLL